MQWISSWQYSSYKPRQTRTLQQLKGCLESAPKLKGWLKKNFNERTLHRNSNIIPSPTFQVEAIPQITQEKYKSPPSANTHQQCKTRTLTQDFMLQCMYGDPRLQAPIYTKTGSIETVPSAVPVQLCLCSSGWVDRWPTQVPPPHEACQVLGYVEKIFQNGGMAPWHNYGNHFFIKKDKIPQECKGNKMYAQIVCVNCNGKKDKYRTCVIMGSNPVNYPGHYRTLTSDLFMVKLLLNSIISMPHSKFMTLNLKDFYLITPWNAMSISVWR